MEITLSNDLALGVDLLAQIFVKGAVLCWLLSWSY